MTHTDAEYIAINLFEDRDGDIRFREVRMVTTRTSQRCSMPSGAHPIPAGTRARYEKAIVEGEWGSYYICVDCCNEALEHPEG